MLRMPSEFELTERERKFLKRLTAKFGNPGRHPFLQSCLVFTVLVLAGHLIERSSLPWWAALAVVYVPAMYLLGRYRRFSIFKSKLMCKLAMREQLESRAGACSAAD